MLRPGSWWLESATNPAWNESGRSEFIGGFEMPPECRAAINRLKETLGDQPDDLTYGYMKD